MDDMTKWAFKEDNRAIQDALERFNDIYVHWFEAQRSVLKFKCNAKLKRKFNKCWFAFREFADCFDDFRQNFKMILEGEQGVESAKSDYEACEHREHKLAKDLKKLSKKAGNCPKAMHQSIFVHLLCKHQLSPMAFSGRSKTQGEKLKL